MPAFHNSHSDFHMEKTANSFLSVYWTLISLLNSMSCKKKQKKSNKPILNNSLTDKLRDGRNKICIKIFQQICMSFVSCSKYSYIPLWLKILSRFRLESIQTKPQPWIGKLLYCFMHLQLKNWDKVNCPSNFSLTSYYLPLFRTEQCSKIIKKVQDLTSWLLCLSLLALSLTDLAILNGEHIVNFERFNGTLLLDGFIFTFCSFMLTIHNPLILSIWSSAKACSSYSLMAFYAVANLFYSSICLHILWFRLERLVVWGLTIRHFLCYHFTWAHVAQM